MKTINVGLASYGMSGEIFHAPLLHAHEGFNIAKILERTKNKSRDRYAYANIVRNYKEITEDGNIDLIVVNTPDKEHYEMALAAIQAGKHVVVEKPFTLKVCEADDLIAASGKTGKLLSVFQNRRWDGDFLTVQKIINEGLLGRLVEYEAHFDRYRNYLQPESWKEQAASGTGTIYNLGSHLIDQALVLFGIPEAVTADIRVLRSGAKVDDAMTLLLKYPEIKVTLKASYLVREPGPRYSLHGTHGSFLKWGLDPQEENLKTGKSPVDPDWGKEDENNWGILNTEINGLHYSGMVETLPGNYMAYYDDIYDAIIHNRTPAVTAGQGRDVIRVIEAAKESSKVGKAAKL
ncbi:MAG: oxidoreductase [Bacteroides sp. SM23_62_1]|nr:MAG: oxidoreductase [Bacteroides sp. SM23_62_1]